MGIKAVLESLDDYPEEVREFYKESDGKYVLDVEGIDDHPNVSGVVTANRENKRKRDEHKARVAELEKRISAIPEDFDPDQYREMKERLEKNAPPDLDERLNKQREKLEQQYKQQITEREQRAETLSKKLQRMVIDDGLSRAMDRAQIDAVHKAKLLPYLKSIGKIEVEETNDGFNAMVDTDMGNVSLDQFVTDWASGEDGKPYVAKSTGPAPRNGHGRNGKNTITRSEFDAMTQVQRKEASLSGVKIVDD